MHNSSTKKNLSSFRRVFLSIPISDSLTQNGVFRPERRKFYESVIESIKDLAAYPVSVAKLNCFLS